MKDLSNFKFSESIKSTLASLYIDLKGIHYYTLYVRVRLKRLNTVKLYLERHYEN